MLGGKPRRAVPGRGPAAGPKPVAGPVDRALIGIRACCVKLCHAIRRPREHASYYAAYAKLDFSGLSPRMCSGLHHVRDLQVRACA